VSARAFLSCDWGTSSFRLRWIEGGQIIREQRENPGCKAVFEQAPASGPAREALYARFLRGALDGWAPAAEPLPLVISGMASSTIGWRELPYARAPLRLDGSNLRYEMLAWDQPPWVSRTFLISGLATDEEIMRGEETEALGLLNGVPTDEDCVLILPGTHSKHLEAGSGQISGITTYLTGELFDLLARHSILKATTDLASLDSDDPACLAAFDAGARQARRLGLGASLFRTRTRAILQGASAGENTWFLSGLLIGAELDDLGKRRPVRRVLLGGAAPLRRLYARVLSAAGPLVFHWEELPDPLVDTAVPRAHSVFLESLGEWTS